MKLCILLLISLFWIDSSAQSPKPSTYAIIIGLSEYKEVSPLQFADRDAIAFADFLKTQDIPEKNVSLFLNQEATRFNIVDELFNLTQTLRPHDRFYFYFGGHGDLEAKIDQENALLLLYNSYKTGYFKGNEYLQLSELKTWFDVLSKKQVDVVFIADACHSGGLIGGKEGISKTQQALQKSWGSITKILSCKATEFSLEGKQWGGGRGIFSYHLVNGLTGRADANKDSNVSLIELSNYLKVNVMREANPNVQTPVVLGNNAQLLSRVSAGGLARLADYEKKSFPVITEVNLKGGNETINTLSTFGLDNSLVIIYRKFSKAIEEKRLIAYDDSTDFALLHYKKLATHKLKADLIQLMKRKLAVALIEREIEVMKDTREKGGGVNMGKFLPKMLPAISGLDEVMKLFGSNHYFYKNLQARKWVLESQIVSPHLHLPYTKSMIKNLDDIKKWNEAQKNTEDDKLSKALQLEPNMTSTYSILAGYYRNKRMIDSAIYYSEKVVELVPNQALAYLSLAGNYSLLNYTDATNKRVPHPKVIQYLEKTIELDSTIKNAYSMLGELYLVGKFFTGQDTLSFHDYPKSIYYHEKALRFCEIPDEELRKMDFTNINSQSSESNAQLLIENKAKLGWQNKYYTYLYFLNKATGNLPKANEYLEKLNRKIALLGSVSAYTNAVTNIYDLCYFDPKDTKLYLTYALAFFQSALTKSDEELSAASAHDKPLLSLKYRELLKAIGSTHRAVENYTEAEKSLQQALLYPVPDLLTKGHLKLADIDAYNHNSKVITMAHELTKAPNGDYLYHIDAYIELFLLKLDQNKLDEAFVWLEKAFQNAVSEHGNEITAKPFEDLVLSTYKTIDKERFNELKTKYFPSASSGTK